ncbi:MAG: TonB-dependent receptor [Nitrospirota bacterium]|nr:TonB-dependent receptor [Nitrospirota bacterium]
MGKRVLVIVCLSMVLLGASAGNSLSEPPPVMTASLGDETLLFQEIPTVTGASKYEQKVIEAPSAVTIVTAADISRHGYRTLADLLRSVRGFYVTYDRNYSYVGVRGFGRPSDYNTRVLLLFDGHRANDNVYDGAYFGTESIIDIDLIDRVEIIRGPGSSLYGSNALFAVVNVIAKRGRDLKSAELAAEAGSQGTAKGRASYGDRFSNGVEALISASAYDSTGQRLYYPEYDSPATNNGVTERTDYDRTENYYLKLSHHDLTFSGAYLARTKGIPTGAFGTDFNEQQNKTRDERAYADLKFERSLSSITDITARLYYDRYRYEGDYAYFQDPFTSALNKDLGSGDWWGSELRLIRKAGDLHRLIFGAEYQGNLRQDQESFYADPYGSIMPKDERRSSVAAAYVQDEITFSSSLLLNAGVRYDRYSTFGGTTNPRLALICNTVGKGTVKALYGSAFRTPNAFELYWQSTTTDANPDLKPEQVRTYELIYEQYLGDRLHGSLSGYYYRINDLITQVTVASGNTMFENIDSVAARGGEVELDAKWRGGIEGRLSFALQRAEDQRTGQPLTNSPAQMAKLAVTAPLVADRVFAGIDEQYLGRRRTEAGNFTPGFGITNITVYGQTLRKRFEVSASVYNLFDRRFGDPVSRDFLQDTILQDGRSFRVKLGCAF